MIDARGLSCPMPVLRVQEAVKKLHPDQLEVLVDNLCARDNVTRFATHQGYQVTSRAEGEDILLVLQK